MEEHRQERLARADVGGSLFLMNRCPRASRLMMTVPGRVHGPGQPSILTTTGGHDLLAYHAWNERGTRRQMCLDPLAWDEHGPRTSGHSWSAQQLPRESPPAG